MSPSDYWKECISNAAEECALVLSAEQLEFLSGAAEQGHECFGMAFYSPPASDRISDIEREWKARFDRLQAEFDAYRGNAETAVKKALNLIPGTNIGIGKDGEVKSYGGRIERIL